MGKMKRIQALIGLKGILSIACLTTIAVALVVYSATVTMTPNLQFYIGTTEESWNLYINEVNQVRYLPGGTVPPVATGDAPDVYAFRVITDAHRVCAVKIELQSPIDSEKFSQFDITVDYWTGDAWAAASIYDSETGSNTISTIDGLSDDAAGYIHQPESNENYYLVKVTYTYDKVADATPITAIFDYTPLARASF
jgi:hypothetical protein